MGYKVLVAVGVHAFSHMERSEGDGRSRALFTRESATSIKESYAWGVGGVES